MAAPEVWIDPFGATLSDPWPEYEFSWRMVAGSLLAVVGATLANSAGVGGGGLFVPMFRLLIGFDVKTSAALSKSMIMGGAVASAVYNLRLKHPVVVDKPFIDFDVALLIQPMLLLGISIGVFCSVVFPDWILTALLILVLLGMAWKTCRTGLYTLREEQHEAPALSSDSCDATCSLEQPLLPSDPTPERLDCSNISILCSVWTLYLVLQILKVKTRPCDKFYWLLNASQIPVSLVPTSVGMWKLRQRELLARKRSVQHGPSFEQMCLYPVYGVLAGTVGGLLGIGGGMVLAPLFLELGVIPQVAAATTTFIVVFSSSMSVIQFYLLGRLPLDFASYFTVLSGFAALLGLHVTKLFVAKYGRTSFIVFILAFIIGASAIVLGIMGSLLDVHKFLAGKYMGFHSLCE